MDDYVGGQPYGSGLQSRDAVKVSWLKPIGLLWLSIYNFIMRILTLGIHHFWGKTEVRKRIWSSVRLNGEPLEYTGTGRELFTGFLIVFAAVLLPTMLLTLAAVMLLGVDSVWLKVFQGALYAFFLFLTGAAIYRAQRYRLNRTRWRGIRAGLSGSSLRYAWTYFWTLLLLPVTFGWIAPWRSTLLQRIVTRDMRFGDKHFRFSGGSGPLYKSFAVFWLLNVVVIGGVLAIIGKAIVGSMNAFQADEGDLRQQLPPDAIPGLLAAIYGGLFVAGLIYMVLSVWYRAAMIRHFARYTHIEGLDFKSSVTARGLLGIAITNYLLLFVGALLASVVLGGLGMVVLGGLSGFGIDPLGLAQNVEPQALAGRIGILVTFVFLFALGMLLPLTQARTSGYLVRNLALSGTIDLATVAAGAPEDIRRGEGLAQAFDIDAL